MKFTFGYTKPTTVEIINRQHNVEYKIISGFAARENDIRAAVGNYYRDPHAYYFDGYYSNRKLVVERLESDIADLKQQIKRMEFALKVTKKKNWKLLPNGD